MAKSNVHYSRGYQAGLRRQWPLYEGPYPPDPVIQELMKALQQLRGDVDGELATLEEDDEISVALGPALERATNALIDVQAWLINTDRAT